MLMSDYTLTFEINSEKDLLEIHCTKGGLEYLKEHIDKLLRKDKDHIHMMPPVGEGEN